jgi:RHS repeat-associated protein
LFDSGTIPAIPSCLSIGSGIDCYPIDWPARIMSTFHEVSAPVGGPRSWFGTLVGEKRDGSGLLYMRNRYYDPKQGRFTQEDPIGLAGGLNLYGYAGGDPVNHSDPFGLRVCFKGSGSERRRLQRATEGAIEADLTVGDDGCVTDVAPWRLVQQNGLLGLFEMLQQASSDYFIAFAPAGCGSPGSCFNPRLQTAFIREGDIGRYYRGSGSPCWIGGIGSNNGQFTLESIIVHELLGHGYDWLTNRSLFNRSPANEKKIEVRAMMKENSYYRHHGLPYRKCY